MNWKQSINRAETLEERRLYFLRLSPYCQDKPEFILVKFIQFTTCPAVVVVEDAKQVRFTCERRKLYDAREEE